MDIMAIRARAQAAQRIAREVGGMLKNHGRMEVHQKADNDFVTEMDGRSEAMIRADLLGQFTDDGFYGEEGGGEQRAKGRWIVDPIDGTQSFMRGHHGYAISIAYESLGELCMGCVYVPDFDEMYVAVRGEGATLNGAPIHVSSVDNLREAIVHLGYGHRVKAIRERTVPLLPRLFEEISDIRRYGSAAYDLCCIARGVSEAFFERGLFLYDIAAGVVILEEAGGKATGWTAGEDCRLTGNILATNGLIHERMMERLA